MDRLLSCRYAFIIMAVAILLLTFNDAYAKAGCCSSHGGVKACNSATHYLMCSDGSQSPTCLCDKSTAPKAAATQTKTTPVLPPVTTNTTKTTTKVTKTETAAKINLSGCCSGHGGVKKCDTSTGYQICKDGAHSTTCACPMKKN